MKTRSSQALSVIVPNYNHGKFLPKRLESILRQSISAFELIILDDASTDDSVAVIEPYLADTRVRLYRNSKNSGSPFAQWNKGVSEARGEFVWIAESDDYAEPTFIERLLPLLQNNPSVGLAYCQSWVVGSNGIVAGTMDGYTADLDPIRWRHQFVADGRSECARYLIWKNTIPNASAVIFRRDVFRSAGCAPSHLRLAGDWLTWVRMLLQSDIAFTPEPLNYFRHHTQTVRSHVTGRQHLEENWLVQQFVVEHCTTGGSTRLRLAGTALSEYYFRVRTAPRGAQWREIKEGWQKFGVWLALHPVSALRAVFGAFRFHCRRQGDQTQRD